MPRFKSQKKNKQENKRISENKQEIIIPSPTVDAPPRYATGRIGIPPRPTASQKAEWAKFKAGQR